MKKPVVTLSHNTITIFRRSIFTAFTTLFLFGATTIQAQTAASPWLPMAFEMPTTSTFASKYNTFVDADNDGDYDVLGREEMYTDQISHLYENVGTNSDPVYVERAGIAPAKKATTSVINLEPAKEDQLNEAFLLLDVAQQLFYTIGHNNTMTTIAQAEKR